MSQQPIMENPRQYDDEIDLRDLIIALWRGKWILVGVTFITCLLAMLYISMVPQTYKANLVVKNIDSFTASNYAPLNATTLMNITPDSLSQQFFDQLSMGESLSKHLIDVGFLTKQETESELDFELRVQGAVRQFSFVAPALSNATKGLPYWQINFVGKQPELARQAIQLAMEEIENQQQRQLVAQFEFGIELEKADIKEAMTMLTTEIAAMRANQLSQVNADIALLLEQAAIARKLQIADNQLLAIVQKYDNNPGVVSLADDKPSYLQGYKALEARIHQLENRDEAAFYDLGMAIAKQKHYMLLNDNSVEQAQIAFDKTPLAQGEFAAVRYNMAAMAVTTKTKPVLLLALAVVLGGMLGVIILVLRNVLRPK